MGRASGQELIGRQREYDRKKEKLRNACEACREDFWNKRAEELQRLHDSNDLGTVLQKVSGRYPDTGSSCSSYSDLVCEREF